MIAVRHADTSAVETTTIVCVVLLGLVEADSDNDDGILAMVANGR